MQGTADSSFARVVNTDYPTQIGITEYNWGAEGFINGATAMPTSWAFWPRRFDSHADHSRRFHANLQGDEDVPQLRR
jgi:hypothetical protein